MPIDTATATLIGASVGALGGFGGVLISTWLSRRSEERKHLRELAVSTAIKNWERMDLDAERLAKQGYRVLKSPIDVYIVHMVMLVDAITRSGMDEKKMEKEMERIHRVVAAVTKKLKVLGEEERSPTSASQPTAPSGRGSS